MKAHAKHVALGGLLVPVVLALSAGIGNGAQTALGLGLHGTALAIFLVGFVAGSTGILHGQLKLETAKIANEFDLPKMLGDLGGLFGGGDEEAVAAAPASAPFAPPPSMIDTPAPPAPPAPPAAPGP